MKAFLLGILVVITMVLINAFVGATAMRVFDAPKSPSVQTIENIGHFVRQPVGNSGLTNAAVIIIIAVILSLPVGEGESKSIGGFLHNIGLLGIIIAGTIILYSVISGEPTAVISAFLNGFVVMK